MNPLFRTLATLAGIAFGVLTAVVLVCVYIIAAAWVFGSRFAK